ncbi:MAG TPA: terminase gpA endonuclease subunit [Phycisphaerae bacterium]|nr:terminase gpA endonuclease subunit [Phycisphaerae bacterium]
MGKPARNAGTPAATRESIPPPAAAPPAEIWSERERRAWIIPPRILPSEWVERHFRIRRGNRKGPYRHENAPYLRGLMDIPTRPGCVQFNLRKPGQIGGSTLLRALMAYWAHVDPAPMGLTLPNRDKGRQISKSEVRPMFRHVPVLRELVGNPARDLLIEEIRLLNGFEVDLMWSGSAASLASNPYKRVSNDEVDKFEPWTGEEPDAISATEGRLTTYGDERLQLNTSTPTTTAGTIHKLYEGSTVRIEFHVPCPHCGHFQPLIWRQLKWLDLGCCRASLAAAEAVIGSQEPVAGKDGGSQEPVAGSQEKRKERDPGLPPQPATGYRLPATSYAIRHDEDLHEWRPCEPDEDGASPMTFADAAALAEHVAWLRTMETRLAAAEGRREIADALAGHRDRAIWYECRHCRGRVFSHDKPAMLRAGRWRAAAGSPPLIDADGREHLDAESVSAWPPETRIGATMTGLASTWIHWGSLVAQWLNIQHDRAALFFFVTFRLGEPFEFDRRGMAESVFDAKSRRAVLPAGVVPRWAWRLLATIDTQPDHFYIVIRAWGGSMRSQRIWHGELFSFGELDRLIYGTEFPVEGDGPPMKVHRTLIDSGGTADRVLDLSRTQQVYIYAMPRQPVTEGGAGVTAIKGSSRPGPGLYWPMKSPMAEGGKVTVDFSRLKALMVNPHYAQELLGDQIAVGTPGIAQTPAGSGSIGPAPARQEQWLLNQLNDPEYNAHMANLQKTIDPKTHQEIWTPRATGARHDYRDCEGYMIVAAYLCGIHLLPDFDEVATWRKREAVAAAAAGDAAGGVEYVERFRK